MTDNKISRKLELELKPQYDFSPNSEDRSSALLSSGEFQAKFFDADDQSYNCEDNKAWLFFGPPPRIYITSEFNKDDAKRLNAHYDYSRIGFLHCKGLPIAFLPRKVSLNDGPCVDIVSLESSSSSSRPGKFSLSWAPKKEPIVVTGRRSTEMKQIIFHLFNFVYFCDEHPPQGVVSNSEPKVNNDMPITDSKADYDMFVSESKAGNDAFISEPKANNDVLIGKLKAKKAKPLSLNFNFGKWAITISQNSKHNPAHVGRIQRDDGEPFNEEEVKKCIEMLGFTFSFVKGAWCKPVCLVGYNALGKCVWQSLSSHPTPKYPAYIPPAHSQHTQLEAVISSLMNKIYSEV